MSSIATAGSPTTVGIDPRGPRFAAALTSVVLAAVVLSPPTVATALLAVQAVVFGVGAVRGVEHTPYAWAFRRLVRGHLSDPAVLEDPRPPRFAQGVGLAFAVIGLIGFLAGSPTTGLVAAGLALAAALLNAVFGLCLGCEVYLFLRRTTYRRTT